MRDNPKPSLANTWVLPPDLAPEERDVAGWMHGLRAVAPSRLVEARVVRAIGPRARGRSFVGVAAAAAALLLAFGLAGFSRAAAEAAEVGCSGARCAEPIVAVVDDPKVPLYQSLEALAAFDGDGGCWEALADLGGAR